MNTRLTGYFCVEHDVGGVVRSLDQTCPRPVRAQLCGAFNLRKCRYENLGIIVFDPAASPAISNLNFSFDRCRACKFTVADFAKNIFEEDGSRADAAALAQSFTDA